MRRFVLIALVGCGTPEPAGVSNVAAGQTPPACAIDRAKPEGLACAVFVALRGGNEQGYAELMLQDPADVMELGKIRTHAPEQPPSDAEREESLRKARAELRETATALRARKLDPSTLELVSIKTDKAHLKGDVGFAEDLTIVVRSNGVTVPVTIDDVAFLRGRWLILDGLKLREH